jgi:soluble lytic murein transglycosylase-like protein
MDLLNTACALFMAANCAVPYVAPITSATQHRIAQWEGFIGEAAWRFDLSADWIRGIMAQESAGFTVWNGRPITSAKGAMGLMQLMPGTWADMRTKLSLGRDPYDPHDNRGASSDHWPAAISFRTAASLTARSWGCAPSVAMMMAMPFPPTRYTMSHR